jgi:phytoene/squalene synthetase
MIDLAARVLGRPLDPAIADLVGTADALAGLALAVPFRAAIGRVDLPADWLAAAGLHAQSVGDRRHRTRLIDVMRRFVEAAQAARREAVAAVAGHHPTQRPALLPLVAARRRLVRLAAVGEDPFDPRLGRPDPWRTLAFWLAARRGRL